MAAREFGDELLRRLLTHVLDTLPQACGVGLSLVEAQVRGGPPWTGRCVAGVGVAGELDGLQWAAGKGPVWEALEGGVPVVLPGPPHRSVEEGGDDAGATAADGDPGDGGPPPGPASWLPEFDRDGEAPDPAIERRLQEVRGAVVVAGEWGGEAPLVMSVYFDRPPGRGDVELVDRVEPVLAGALAVVEHCAGQELRADQMVQMMQYRRVIEQAKGLVMSALGVDAATAFDTLARASQHFNIRLRNLTVALVEHVGAGTAEGPDDPEQVVTPSEQDRRVAVQVWGALSTSDRAGADPAGDRPAGGRSPGERPAGDRPGPAPGVSPGRPAAGPAGRDVERGAGGEVSA